MMVRFVKGKKLSELFFYEVVNPLLRKYYPNLKYSAALLGYGSDVIGFDTARSMDHDWGPRVLLFLSEREFKKKKQISEMFSDNLPYIFRDFPTNFEPPDEKGVRILSKIAEGKIRHGIEIFTIELFFRKYLYFDIKREIQVYDWLVFSEQKLLTITSGKVFKDDLGLKKTIKRFHYYPKDIWYYLLASQWMRIFQEEHFMGRCGEVNDEIGSKIIALRLIKDIMGMCFLMEKKYTPYIKWFGTGFKALKSSKKITPLISAVLRANDWKSREKYLCQAYEYIAKLHNTLKITQPLKSKVGYFYGRPFLIINGELFADEIKKRIKDPIVKAIKFNAGSVNQFSDSSEVLETDTQKFKSIYL